MNFFKRQNRKNNSPSEVIPLTDNLVAPIWEATRDGKQRHWLRIQRKGNDGQLLATLRPENLVELVTAVGLSLIHI